MPFETVSIEIDGHIAIVIMGRAGAPGAENLIDERTATDLVEAFDQVEENGDVWVLILTGADGVFCRGAKPSTLRGCGDMHQRLNALRVAGRLARVRIPTIAAINGDALGQGLELALACDVRIASAGARLGMTHLKTGFIPWDGGTQSLPRLLGLGRAMEMVLTSREVDVEEAMAMGLVNLVARAGQALHRAQETARSIASHGPIAARYVKEAVLKGMDLTLEQGLRLEADLGLILHGTADRAEGISSFLERREPTYRGQ